MKLKKFADVMNKGNKDLTKSSVFNPLSRYLNSLKQQMVEVYRKIKHEEKMDAILEE